MINFNVIIGMLHHHVSYMKDLPNFMVRVFPEFEIHHFEYVLVIHRTEYIGYP